MKSKTKIIFILLFYFFVKISDSCHQCHSNYAACHDERSYTMCSAGIPNDVMLSCPEGYVCTSKTSICLKSTAAKPVQPTCQMKCGTCNSQGKLYSCLSNTTYALCFGADTPYLTAQGTCPDGYFCNLESGTICTKATDSSPSCNAIIEPTNPPTLPTTTEEEPVTTTELPITTTESPVTATEAPITTTENPIKTTELPFTPTEEPVTTTSVSVDPTESTPTVVESSTAPSTQSTLTSTTKKSQYESSFCSGKEIGGSYKLESDPTCRRFVLCYVLAGQYLELHYICPSSQFYNEETRDCQREKPITCMQTWKKFNFF